MLHIKQQFTNMQMTASFFPLHICHLFSVLCTESLPEGQESRNPISSLCFSQNNDHSILKNVYNVKGCFLLTVTTRFFIGVRIPSTFKLIREV